MTVPLPGASILLRLARARADGKTLGRPSGMTPAKDRKARKLLAKSIGVVKIATELGVGTGTIQCIKAEMGAAVEL